MSESNVVALPTPTTAPSTIGAPRPGGARMTHTSAARIKLRSALRLLEKTKPLDSEVRRAHLASRIALEELTKEVAIRDEHDAEAARQHMIRVGRRTRDVRGRRRAPCTLPGYNRGRTPGNKGKRYDPTPPTINEVLRMLALVPTMHLVHNGECPTCQRKWHEPHAQECMYPWSERFKALIYLLWRGGLRIGCEALRLTENDLHPSDGYIYIAHGKGDKSREVVIDDWVWPLLEPWLNYRQAYEPGPLFCIIDGSTAGVNTWAQGGVRVQLHALAKLAGIRHRVTPHQFRHAMAVEQLEEGVNPLYISRNMGHASLQVTDNYFKGLPQSRVVQELRGRPIPRVTMFDVLRSEGSNVSDRAHRPSTPDLMGALKH